jgi:hypothetical protein
MPVKNTIQAAHTKTSSAPKPGLGWLRGWLGKQCGFVEIFVGFALDIGLLLRLDFNNG